VRPGSDCARILANLHREIIERQDHGDSSDDLTDCA
jgi:hypothetical protein